MSLTLTQNPQTVALTPKSETELAEILVEHHGLQSPLWIKGGGTRLQTAQAFGQHLDLRGLCGITDFEPAATTLIVKAGTPLSTIEATLAQEGQRLAFEPPLLAPATTSTIGGVIATNASGTRRVLGGAARDHLLGLRFLDGRGRAIKSGGRVMKNVTGLDLGKMLCGSWGTLGVISELVLKTQAISQSETTLRFSCPQAADAVALFCTILATPFEISAAAWQDGIAYLRIEGIDAQVENRRDNITRIAHPHRPLDALDMATSQAHWQNWRRFAWRAPREAPSQNPPSTLWAIGLKPTQAAALIPHLAPLAGRYALDWGGSLVLFESDAPASAIRALPFGGQAQILDGLSKGAPRFAPLAPLNAQINASLRRNFDPKGILNPGLMEP